MPPPRGEKETKCEGRGVNDDELVELGEIDEVEVLAAIVSTAADLGATIFVDPAQEEGLLHLRACAGSTLILEADVAAEALPGLLEAVRARTPAPTISLN
jgi:hypothetical protein